MTQEKFENVTLVAKANIYFDGKVVSHTFLVGGAKRTLGLIYPGTYKFDTAAKERMDITAGACRVKMPGQSVWTNCGAGTFFDIPANSAFEIAVDGGVAEYLCTYG